MLENYSFTFSVSVLQAASQYALFRCKAWHFAAVIWFWTQGERGQAALFYWGEGRKIRSMERTKETAAKHLPPESTWEAVWHAREQPLS